MSRTFHSRKARTKKANAWRCTCWFCIGSKAYDHKNSPPMPDPYELEGLQDEMENPGFYEFLRGVFGTDEDLEDAWDLLCPFQELRANIQEHVAYQWTGRPLPFARQHRNNWRRHLTKRFLASRYFRSERHTKLFQDFIMNLTKKPLTRR